MKIEEEKAKETDGFDAAHLVLFILFNALGLSNC